MARYVDIDAAIEELYDADAITMRGVKLLRQIEPADVLPVVRCKHCRHHGHDDWCSVVACVIANPEWYCADGEVREDG